MDLFDVRQVRDVARWTDILSPDAVLVRVLADYGYLHHPRCTNRPSLCVCVVFRIQKLDVSESVAQRTSRVFDKATLSFNVLTTINNLTVLSQRPSSLEQGLTFWTYECSNWRTKISSWCNSPVTGYCRTIQVFLELCNSPSDRETFSFMVEYRLFLSCSLLLAMQYWPLSTGTIFLEKDCTYSQVWGIHL